MNNPKLRTNPEFEQTQKFPSGLRSLRSLRKNNKLNPKNEIEPKLWTNPEFEQTQKSRTEWAPFAPQRQLKTNSKKELKQNSHQWMTKSYNA